MKGNRKRKRETETLWSKDYLLILLVSTISSFTNSVFISVFPVYVLDLGGNNALTGLMLTGMTIASMITRVLIGPLIDRWGRKKILVLGAFGYTLNALCFCFVTDLKGLFVLRICHGITQGIFFPVPPTVVADVSPKERLVDAIGFFGAASSLMFAVAPVVSLAIYQKLGAVPLYVTAALFALVSAILSLFVREHYQYSVKQERSSKKLVGISAAFERAILLPSLVYFFVYFGTSAVTNYVAACGLQRGLEAISVFFLVDNVVIIMMRVLTGRLTKCFSRKVLIGAGVFLCAAATGIVAVAYHMVWMIVAAVLMGIGITLVAQLLQVQVLDMVPDSRRGVANSTFLLMGDMGTGLGGSVWGAASAYMGYLTAYVMAAFSTLLGLIFCIAKKNRN